MRPARITAIEGRALVHVDFDPVGDVNNNPRNPVINIRSFGEDAARVGALASAWVRGPQQGGMLAFFGSPYVPMRVPDLPAMLLTYDFSDGAEESAVRAIAGEIAIGGRLPIALPGMFPVGHGLARRAVGSR